MEKKNQQKKITQENTVEIIQRGFSGLEKKLNGRIDNLAEMVQRGFVDVETRLGARIDGVEKRLNGVENRLNGVENRLNGVETRLDNVVTDISDMRKEIVKKLDQKIDQAEFTKLEKRFDVLEEVAV